MATNKQREKRQSRQSRFPLLLIALTILPQPTFSQWQDNNDPTNLCTSSTSTSVTGYKPTRDCRGFVYCADGYLMGGAIPCWPNQLYDESIGCTSWQNVDTSACPDYDGSMMMPDAKDEKANEERFFCGLSTSHAKEVCEACAGGSRLECSDPTHTCFAKIDGCPTSPSASTSPVQQEDAANIPAMEQPTSQQQLVSQPIQTPTNFPTLPPTNEPVVVSQPTTNSPTNKLVLVDVVPVTLPNIESTTSSNEAPLINTNFCGLTWEAHAQDCDNSLPCPQGDECGAGEQCFAGSPCAALISQEADANIVALNEPKMNSNFCGVSWEDHGKDCANSLPCPQGDECRDGEVCFNGSPCAALISQEADATVAESEVLSSQANLPTAASLSNEPMTNTNFCGVSWEAHALDCDNSLPCPQGDECGAGEQCFNGSPCAALISQEADATVAESNVLNTQAEPQTTASLSNQPKMNTNFCGVSWAAHALDCNNSLPCPQGDECSIGEQCFNDSPCAALISQEADVNVEESNVLNTQAQPQTTASLSNEPMTNTNFCGVSWAVHIKDCANSSPCPNGDECAVGEHCFSGSPCSEFIPQEEDINGVEPEVGSFCGTEWNLLMTSCETSRRCPNGNECEDGEFCYRDFPCEASTHSASLATSGSNGSPGSNLSSSASVDGDGSSNPKHLISFVANMNVGTNQDTHTPDLTATQGEERPPSSTMQRPAEEFAAWYGEVRSSHASTMIISFGSCLLSIIVGLFVIC